MSNDKIKKFIKLIHIAKNELNLSDEEYRKILAQENIKSCSEIKTEEKAVAVFSRFKGIGFSTNLHPKNRSFKNTQKGGGYNRITSRQEYYIRGLWNLCMEKSRSDESLDAFVKRVTGVPFLHWITVSDASKVIVALQKIALANGYNPEHRG